MSYGWWEKRRINQDINPSIPFTIFFLKTIYFFITFIWKASSLHVGHVGDEFWSETDSFIWTALKKSDNNSLGEKQRPDVFTKYWTKNKYLSFPYFSQRLFSSLLLYFRFPSHSLFLFFFSVFIFIDTFWNQYVVGQSSKTLSLFENKDKNNNFLSKSKSCTLAWHTFMLPIRRIVTGL